MFYRTRRFIHEHGWAVVGIAGLLLAGIVLTNDYLKSRPYDPLGTYPIQTVLSRVDGVRGPAIHVGDRVQIEGTKCNKSGKTVTVRGQAQWQSISPPGLSGGRKVGIADRPPGCVTQVFINDIPDDVRRQMRQAIADNGGRPAAWSISGEEFPINPDTNEDGIPRRWRTEAFLILP